MATHAHSTPPAYTLGRHPRRTDHPALLNLGGTPAWTFAYNATRAEIAEALLAGGLILNDDDSVVRAGEQPPVEAASLAPIPRRGLLSALAAAAAGVAVLAAPANPAAATARMGTREAPFAGDEDAVLIAQCERFKFLETDYGRFVTLTDILSSDPRPPEYEAWEAEREAISDEQHALGEVITETVPRTAKGLQAKAVAALVYLNDDPPRDMIEGMERSILRHLAAQSAAATLLSPSPVAGDPDAHLIGLETLMRARIRAADEYDSEAPGNNWDNFSELQVAMWQVADQIPAVLAHTPEGLQAKARALREVIDQLGNREDKISVHALSLVRDILGEAGV